MDLGRLTADLPIGAVLTDRDVIDRYRRDWAGDPNAGWPVAVVRATCTEDVQVVLRWASEHGVPVVPRGAGSGLSGGSTAVDGGLVLSTEKMRDIRIDPVSRVAITQPGLLNVEVKRAAAEHGLWYPPDPSSFEMCSIGGNAATNAGGLCCVKYGVTTDYVLGMQVVLADGTALSLGGPRLKDVAGLSLTKLFVGSEGVLGVITELTLRLLPAQPPASTLVAVFPSIESAADAVLAITSSLRPCMLELMDRTSILLEPGISALSTFSKRLVDTSFPVSEEEWQWRILSFETKWNLLLPFIDRSGRYPNTLTRKEMGRRIYDSNSGEGRRLWRRLN